MKNDSTKPGKCSFPIHCSAWLDLALGPLTALVLLVGASLPAQDNFHQSNGNDCPLEGTAKSDAAKTLDRNKNRSTPPTSAQIDSTVSLAGMLAPGEDTDRFEESKGATVSGFVVDVKMGGKETCKCGATNPVDRDTHIELALSPDAPENQRVIVEVTPRLRAIMKQQNIDWSTKTLADANKGIKGKWVQISGWLLFDVMHIGEAENTNPGNPKNWRATCWEIHPISDIKVVSGSASQPPRDLQPLHPDVMTAFHKARSRDFAKADKKAGLETRNKQALSKFQPSEIEEDDSPEKVE